MLLKVTKKYPQSNLFHPLIALAISAGMITCQSEWTEQRLGGERISDLVRNEGAQQMDSIAAKLDFEEIMFSFDTITEGSVVSHNYHFVNSGHAPLLIASAKSSCGCTVPNWPREVISVGEEGNIEVKFNSENRSGKVSKSVKIVANTNPRETTLYFNVFVKPRTK